VACSGSAFTRALRRQALGIHRPYVFASRAHTVTFAGPDVSDHGFLGVALRALDARDRLTRLSVHFTFTFTTAREDPQRLAHGGIQQG
jgi:hypothetical protein